MRWQCVGRLWGKHSTLHERYLVSRFTHEPVEDGSTAREAERYVPVRLHVGSEASLSQLLCPCSHCFLHFFLSPLYDCVRPTNNNAHSGSQRGHCLSCLNSKYSNHGESMNAEQYSRTETRRRTSVTILCPTGISPHSDHPNTPGTSCRPTVEHSRDQISAIFIQRQRRAYVQQADHAEDLVPRNTFTR